MEDTNRLIKDKDEQEDSGLIFPNNGQDCEVLSPERDVVGGVVESIGVESLVDVVSSIDSKNSSYQDWRASNETEVDRRPTWCSIPASRLIPMQQLINFSTAHLSFAVILSQVLQR